MKISGCIGNGCGMVTVNFERESRIQDRRARKP